MEQIALIIGDNYIYWSAVIRVMAAAAAICAFFALYLRTGKSPVAALTGIPLAIISSLVLSRVASWYFHPESTLEAALEFSSPGGFALMGVFAGCFLTAAFLRLVKLTDNLPQLLDCMAAAGALGIAAGRLGSSFNASDRGMILPETVGFPWAAAVVNPVSGVTEYRLATFLLQSMAAGVIFFILLILNYLVAASIIFASASASPSKDFPPAVARPGCPPPPPRMSFAASRTSAPAFLPAFTRSSVYMRRS